MRSGSTHGSPASEHDDRLLENEEERSNDGGTPWVVFEPNDEPLWTRTSYVTGTET
jgi:hypothetical protein